MKINVLHVFIYYIVDLSPQTQIPANLPALEMIKYKHANFITTNALFCEMHIFHTQIGACLYLTMVFYSSNWSL